ncbi:MAG: AAA family ATPase [Tannerella sp.]|jgi:SpoVK/Ycf46/Vps4 family AAA+-type ATPase|nr:AAA family ATPase [Tannerella sp.]
MIDNTNNTKIHDKEIEKLLGNFTGFNPDETDASSGCEISIGGKPCRLIPCRSNGTKYMIPFATACDYTFETMTPEINCRDISENRLCFRKPGDDLSFRVLFDSVSCGENETRYKSVFVLLYKQGTGMPVATMSGCPDDERAGFNFRDEMGELPVGDYFMLVSNMAPGESSLFDSMGGNARFSFRILPDGETMRHPRIVEFGVTRRLRDDCAYSSGSIVFRFVPDSPVNDADEYAVSCFNADLRLMGKQRFTGNAACRRNREMRLKVNAGYIWMPGPYFCILEHNGDPFYKVGFTVTKKSVDECAGEYVGKNTAEYVLVKYLENDSAPWKDMADMTGVTSIRRKLMECGRNGILNRLREQRRLSRVECNANYICVDNGSAAGMERLLRNFAGIVSSSYSFRYVDCARLTEAKNTADSYEDTTCLPDNICHTVTCLSNPGSLLSGNGSVILRRIEEKLRRSDEWALYLAGTAAEISLLFETCPALTRYFPDGNRIERERSSVAELVHCLQMKLTKQRLVLTAEAENRLATSMLEASGAGRFARWNEDSVTDFIGKGILPRFRNRILAAKHVSDCSLTAIEAEDVETDRVGDSGNSFDESMKALNEMVGLANLKRTISTTFNRVKFDALRREMGLRTHDSGSHHMIFTGNPGTGKTTVARMVGKIYHSLGLLSVGDVIVTERGRMVGSYIGHTEKNMQAILAGARGNVLFVDEAYSLCNGVHDRRDFGYRAIECLLTVMAQKNPDMLVIFAGYEREMEAMMQMNSGLKGRFPYTFHFEDYSAEELMQIAENLLNGEDYQLTGEARSFMQSTVEETVARKDVNFGNARWVGQYVSNGIIPAMADRLINGHTPVGPESFRLIETSDVETAWRKFEIRPSHSDSRRNRVGFITGN